MNTQFITPLNILAQHFSLLLHRCITKHKALKLCKQIHALMLTKDIDMDYQSLGSRLIGAYACCGDLTSSKLLFDQTPNRNAFAFNWMILTLSFSGFHQEAIKYFILFQESRDNISKVYLNKYSFSAVMKGCIGLRDAFLGKQIHGMIRKVGLERDVSVCNSLIDMYGKCGDIWASRKVFDEMSERDVASWTTMICRYADTGEIEKSVCLFRTMRFNGTEPNDHTWNAIIAAHAKIGDCDGAYRIFLEMGSEGLFPDLATWNAMITGFVQNQRALEALELFQDMLVAEIKPDEVTIAGLLPVCGIIDSVNKGREIHGLVYRIGLGVNNVFIASALIDMYSKCGSIKHAWNIFNTDPNKNVASWNSMIGCYGKHGMVSSALKLYETMQAEKIRPNEVTFLSLISACSHGGFVQKGLDIFKTMESYGVRETKEHYSCLIDLLCRYGKMDEAYDIVKQIRGELVDSHIGAFLNGCIIHQRRDLAKKISNHLGVEPKKPGDFVTLSNIYASENKWKGVQHLRKVMKHKKVCKNPGFSSV